MEKRCSVGGEPKQATARFAAGVMKVERHVEAGEQLPQLMGFAVLEPAYDVEQLEAGLLVLGPFSEELADLALQVLLEHPRLGEVVVGLAERHGADDRASR